MGFGKGKKFNKKVKPKNQKDAQQDKIISKLKKEIEPEVKCHYVTQAETATTTTLTFFPLDSIPQAVSNNSRIGGKVRVKGVHGNIFVRGSSADVVYLYRAFIVRAVASATYTDATIMNPASPLGNFATNSNITGGKYAGAGNLSNVKVLWDSGPLDIQPWSGTATGYIGPKSSRVLKFRLSLNHQSSYESDSTQQPDRNAMYLVCISNNAAVLHSINTKTMFVDQ